MLLYKVFELDIVFRSGRGRDSKVFRGEYRSESEKLQGAGRRTGKERGRGVD